MSESLTSYLSRLAEAHCVTVGTLVGKEIAPILGKKYILKSSKYGGNAFYKSGNAINGLGKLSDDFVQCLSELTGINDIKDLTLVALNDVLPIRDIFRVNKAWCPLCLEEWRRNNNPIYDPLIWSFKAVKFCDIHGINLKMRCPMCKKEIPVLSRKSQNGFCSFCGCWLGLNDFNPDGGMSLKQSPWEFFSTSNIGTLISHKNDLKRASRSDIYMFIKIVVDKIGGLCAFSRYFDIPKSSASQWLKGLHRPTLQTLLKICYHLKVNLIEVFSPEKICFDFSPHNSFIEAKKDKKSNCESKRMKIDWNVVGNNLIKIISDKVNASPSVNEVAKGLGCTKRSLYYHFSDLCKKISANHAEYLRLMKKQRIKEASREVIKAVYSLKKSGFYPSRRRVEDLLTPDIILRESAYQIAWKKALIDTSLVPDKLLNKS